MKKENSVTPGRLLTNAAYVFVVLMAAFAVSELIGIVIGWIVPADTLLSSRGDLSHNYYVVYPIRGFVMLLVFFGAMFIFSRKHGYRVAFSHREKMTTADFLIETVIAFVVYEALMYWIAREVLPSWYLSGTLAALFGVFDATDIYNSAFAGTVLSYSFDIEEIALYYYLWLQILLDLLFAIVSIFILRKGRLIGEAAARKAHDQQLAEMRQESGLK